MVNIKYYTEVDQDFELDVIYNAMSDDEKLQMLEWLEEDFPTEEGI